MRAILLLVALFVTLPFRAHAADSSMTPLPTVVATDGKTYAANFAAGLSLDNGQTFRSDAVTGVEVLIQGRIAPDPAHVGKKGSLFIVERIGSAFFMRTKDGTFMPWPSVSVRDLVPAAENITLSASHTVEVYKGKINEAATHRIFLGYMVEGASGLIYTGSALPLSIAQNTDAFSLFDNTLFSNVVMSKCALCHVRGGVADGRSSLLFVRDAARSRENFDILKSFFTTRTNAYDYVLSKASGGDRHVGGAQLAKGSSDYNALQSFLTVLDGRVPATTTATTPSAQFFNGVILESGLQTWRRAAIRLAGRAPTAAEQSAVASGGEAALRDVLREMMQGSVFHEFLKDAANDRLLVRAATLPPVNECIGCFPIYNSRSYKLEEDVFLTGQRYRKNQFLDQVRYGGVEAPLELIASVVENDRKYSEILTADYTMLNPVLAESTNTSVTFTTGKPTEFRQARISEYYRRDQSAVWRNETRFFFNVLVTPSKLRGAYPHVGVLNDMAFTNRYPSTATNRNRARARWTYFHFLGVDIEQSAQRTTDAQALADTNNPTMNNPNCTVCHAIMDPVAGAFQHYGDSGYYLEGWGGMDALDGNYKFPGTGSTLYRQGDTWYRDMRAPGFNGLNASGDDSLRWLANQIVADPRFVTAAVRFWWPAIMGQELLKRPEVATDADYAGRLLAYDAQEAAIVKLAANFLQSGMKVKSLLVDLLMSEWFRAERIDASKVSAVQMQSHWIAGLGDEKLLTPEQLARKTWALTGFNWKSFGNVGLDVTEMGLVKFYSLYYGGIDSAGVTKRARELTPLMSATALTMALESSCPIVYGEFILPDAKRKLLTGIEDFVTPITEGAQGFTVDSTEQSQFKTVSFALPLSSGAKRVAVSFLNEYCDWDAANNRCRSNSDVFIGSLSLQRPDGTRVQVSSAALEQEGKDCGKLSNALALYNANCTAVYRFNADTAGLYTVDMQVSAKQAGPDLTKILLAFEADVQPALSSARGALLIKQKLVELHQTLLGKTLTIASPEITDAFTLLVDTWQAKRTSKPQKHLMTTDSACVWNSDFNHLNYVGYPGASLVLNTSPDLQTWKNPPWSEISSWYQPLGQDNFYMKRSWQVVVAYLLSHYDYLYE